MPSQDKYLVVAWGSPGRGDGAAGLAIAESLAGEVADEVEIRCFEHLRPDLAADVASADHVIFLDAHVHPGWPDLIVEEVEPAVKYHPGPHTTGPEELMALSQVLYHRRPNGWLVATRAFDTSCGAGLSPRTLKLVVAARRIVLSMLPAAVSTPVAPPEHGPWPAGSWN